MCKSACKSAFWPVCIHKGCRLTAFAQCSCNYYISSKYHLAALISLKLLKSSFTHLVPLEPAVSRIVEF